MMQFEDRHSQFCSVYDGQQQGEPPNETRPCSCGYRAKKQAREATARGRLRAIRPLGMPESTWLRTLGIKPEEDL